MGILDQSKIARLMKARGEVKKEMESIYVQNEKGGVKVLVRGDKKIEKLEIGGEDQKALRELLNDTMKDVDKKLEKQMRGRLSDFGFNI